jgi:hypothetical protein
MSIGAVNLSDRRVLHLSGFRLYVNWDFYLPGQRQKHAQYGNAGL